MIEDKIEKHSTLQSIFLHLLPGFMVGSFYFIALKPVERLGYPSFFALFLAFTFILIPFELGFLLYQGKKKTGRFTLRGIISFCKPIPFWQYLIWPLIIFGIVGALMTLFQPLDSLLHTTFFLWMPNLTTGLDGNYSKSVLIMTYALGFIINIFFAPVIEELYFRGYLFPRMKGKYAALFHSFLFAAVHIFSPWMIISRTIGFLPIIFVTTKKNIYVGMIVHMLSNSVGIITGILYISKMV